MGLEEIRVALTGHGSIAVNNKQQTSIKGIYAARECMGD